MTEQIMTLEDVAKYFDVDQATVAQWAYDGVPGVTPEMYLPRYYPTNTAPPVYLRSHVESFHASINKLDVG